MMRLDPGWEAWLTMIGVGVGLLALGLGYGLSQVLPR